MLAHFMNAYGLYCGLSPDEAGQIMCQEDGTYTVMLGDQYLCTLEETGSDDQTVIRLLTVLEGGIEAKKLPERFAHYADLLAETALYGVAGLGLDEEIGAIYLTNELSADELDDEGFCDLMERYVTATGLIAGTAQPEVTGRYDAAEQTAVLEGFLKKCGLSPEDLPAGCGRVKVSDSFSTLLEFAPQSGRVLLHSFISDRLNQDALRGLLAQSLVPGAGMSFCYRNDALYLDQSLDPAKTGADEFAEALRRQELSVQIMGETISPWETLPEQPLSELDPPAEAPQDSDDTGALMPDMLI